MARSSRAVWASNEFRHGHRSLSRADAHDAANEEVIATEARFLLVDGDAQVHARRDQRPTLRADLGERVLNGLDGRFATQFENQVVPRLGDDHRRAIRLATLRHHGVDPDGA
jgi:hypothetical protein